MLAPALTHALRPARRPARGDRPRPHLTARWRAPALFARLIKVEHTLFALPFAYVGAFLAVDGVPSAHDLLWITVAMAGARSLAMALNRLIDVGIDAANPRTAGARAALGRADASPPWSSSALASLAVFLVAVWQLDPVVRWLWPIPVAAFVIYPYLKRFTWLCHFWLGAVDGLAPIGGWVAITRRRSPGRRGRSAAPSPPGSPASTSSTRSSTSRSTARRASTRSRCASASAAPSSARGCSIWRPSLLLVAVGLGLPVGWWYWAGVAAVAGLLAYEHSLVRPGDLRRLDAAFFTMNGVISVAFFAFVARRRRSERAP